MLKTTQEITFSGKSVVNDVEVEAYTARIKSDNPEDVTFSSWQMNKELYKQNRTQCRADQAEFEDMVYVKQDEMIANVATEQEA